MKEEQDFQNRLAGIAGAVLLIVFVVIVIGVIHKACEASDSGKMHGPSAWR